MTGIAVMFHGPSHNFPGAIEFVIVVLVIILAIFVRMYGPRRRSGPRTTHKTPHSTVRHQPGQGGNDGRRSSSKRRASRP